MTKVVTDINTEVAERFLSSNMKIFDESYYCKQHWLCVTPFQIYTTFHTNTTRSVSNMI